MRAFRKARFADRSEAGRQLAAALRRDTLVRPVVFALPRGGVPVASPEAIAALRDDADSVLCLQEDDLRHGVGGCYDDFHQLDDSEVIRLLDAAAARPSIASG